MTAADLIVKALADSDPRGVTSKMQSPYCVLCGAIEGAGDTHAHTCPWRLAVEATYPDLIPALRTGLYPDELIKRRQP